MEITSVMQDAFALYKDSTPFLIMENVHLQHHIYDTTIPERVDATLPDLSSYDFVKDENITTLSTPKSILEYFAYFRYDGVQLDGSEMFLSQKAKNLFKFIPPEKVNEAFTEFGGFECDFNDKMWGSKCTHQLEKGGCWIYKNIPDENKIIDDFIFVVCDRHDSKYHWDQSGSFLDWCPLFMVGTNDKWQTLFYNINPDCPLYHRLMVRLETDESAYIYVLDCTLEKACQLLECLYKLISNEEMNTGDRPYPMEILVKTFKNQLY